MRRMIQTLLVVVGVSFLAVGCGGEKKEEPAKPDSTHSDGTHSEGDGSGTK